MTVVYTNNQEVDVRQKLKELDRPVGVAGNALLRAETPQEQFNLIGAGRKNIIINGNMQIAQRGTSFGPTQNTIYTLDRWKVARYAANNFYTSQEIETGEYPFTNYVKVRRNTGDTASGAVSLHQKIEPQNFKHCRGQVVTLSFWYKTGSTYSPPYLRAGIIGSTTSGASLTYWGYSSGAVGISDKTIPASNEWKQHSISYKVPSNIEELAVAFGVESPYNWTETAGSDDSFSITGVQLELGSVATPFEHRSYNEELALCQRYYQIHYTLGSGVQNSATSALVAVHLPTTMREVPALSTKSGTMSNINVEHDDTYDVTSIAISHGINNNNYYDERSSFIATVNTSGTNTIGYGVCVMCDRNGDYFTFDAEL